MPLRQALSKLTLPIFMVASFGLMLLGKADALLAERARMAVADALSPLYAALAEPLSVVHRGIEGAQHLATRRMPACARRTTACAAGRPWPWRWMRRTPR